MVTSICNIFINTPEKLRLFEQALPKVFDVSDNWLIYIRGKYRQQALRFVRELDPNGSNSSIFHKLDDTHWAKSVVKMIREKARYDYFYIFLEDHLLLRDINSFKKAIVCMIDNDIDYWQYSFFNIGLSTCTVERYFPDDSEFFSKIVVNRQDLVAMRKLNQNFYPFALTAVISKKYFLKLLEKEKGVIVKVPLILQVLMENIFFYYPRNRTFWHNINKIARYFNIRFSIFSRATPFNLEKSLFDCDGDLLPLKIGVLKDEMFANWDDDNKRTSSSLIKRGLYPPNLLATKPKREIVVVTDKIYSLRKGESRQQQYYPDINRINDIPRKGICVKKGSIRVSCAQESFVINAESQTFWIHANIPHVLLALEDSDYQVQYA